MKQFPYLLFVFLFVLLFESCRKNNGIGAYTLPAKDTLFPKPYLPIYPGSWWTYIRLSDSTTFTDTAGKYIDASASNREFHSKHFFVPTLHGIPQFGYGFDTSFYISFRGYYDAFTYRIKEEPGSTWTYYYDADYAGYNNTWTTIRQTDSVGLTKVIGDTTFTNVIRIVETIIPDHGASPFPPKYFYYAKNVGLIEWGEIPASDDFPEFRLVDYRINH